MVLKILAIYAYLYIVKHKALAALKEETYTAKVLFIGS